MLSTVIGRFHLAQNAENAIRELEGAGFTLGEIGLIGLTEPWNQGSAIESLVGMHVPEDDARDYTRAMEEGAVVLAVQTDDRESADRALAIFDRLNGLDNLHQALSRSPEPAIQAAHLRGGAKPRTSARIYACEDPVANAAMADFEAEWRRDFNEIYPNSGYRYEQLCPAYRYGAELAVSHRYCRREWKDIERAVRKDWERRNPHTWEPASKAIRYAWDSVRARIMEPTQEALEPAR